MIPYGKHHLEEDDIQAVVAILRGGALTQGPTVDAFERVVADYVGARFAVATASGTAALHLAAMIAGVGPGSALATSPITFIASANAALYVSGTPCFVDIDRSTVNMSPAALRSLLEHRRDIKAVVPVHFAGLPCDMPPIRAAADSAGAVVIEDAAHALGARYPNGSLVGCCAHSLMTVFSFHPVKAVAAGEGGMITTNDEHVYRRLLRLRSHGINKADDPLIRPADGNDAGQRNPWYYEMQELGYHYRITDIQCALGMSQFQKLDRFIARRRELAHRYDAAFAGLRKCHAAQQVGRELSGHHIYVLRIDFAGLGLSRGDVMRRLRAQDIGSHVHYIPVPAQPHYRSLGFDPVDYPEAAAYYREALTIPLYYDLSDAQQDYIIAAILSMVA